MVWAGKGAAAVVDDGPESALDAADAVEPSGESEVTVCTTDAVEAAFGLIKLLV